MYKGYIYKITSPSGKSYIGQTTDINRRFAEHKRDARQRTQRPIYKAIIKYGWENMEKTIIEVVTSNSLPELHELLNDKEVYYIDHYKTFGDSGYNCTIGGDGTMGLEHTESTRQKLSQKSKAMWQDSEQREKIAKAMDKVRKRPGYGANISRGIKKKHEQDPQYRQKISRAPLKAWQDPKFRSKQSKISKELWQDEEYREKTSKRIKEAWENNPKLRQYVNRRIKQAWQNPKLRERQSISQKKRWENEEERRRQSEVAKKFWSDPEYRAKLSGGGNGRAKPISFINIETNEELHFEYIKGAYEYFVEHCGLDLTLSGFNYRLSADKNICDKWEKQNN